jgi:Ran GTPase-activating protein (RanGAP) involved in mRNA processing and transport
MLQTQSEQEKALAAIEHSIYQLHRSTPTIIELSRNFYWKPHTLTKFAHVLSANSSTKSLGLGSCQLGTEGVVVIAEALQSRPPTLESLDVSNNFLGFEAMNALQACLPASLSRLHLQANDIGDAGLMLLTPRLARCPKLSVLDLAANSLGDSGAEALARVLKALPSLRVLNLASNFISFRGLHALCLALAPLSGFNSLCLDSNLLCGRAGISLALLLERTKSLTALSLAGAPYARRLLGWEGSEGLAAGLIVNRTLQKLNVAGQHASTRGLLALMVAIERSEVWWLNLRTNWIGDDGARMVAASLAKPRCKLYALDLSDNNISLIGANALATVLRDSNRSLGVVRAFQNEFSDEGAKNCVLALRRNPNLMVLDLPFHNVRSMQSTLLEGLLTNRRSTFIVARADLTQLLNRSPYSDAVIKLILEYMAHDAFKTIKRPAKL